MPADSRKLLTGLQRPIFLSVGKLKLCIFLSFIVLCVLQPTANYDLAVIEDYLSQQSCGKRKNQNIDKKQNGVVVIFSEPWQLLLTGSAAHAQFFNGSKVDIKF